MRMDPDEARRRFGAARVARLATASPAGRPHLVPIVFALDGDILYTSVDDKPKTTRELRRLAHIAANPAVSVLVDHYADDWTQLWWVRADGTARIIDGAEAQAAIERLVRRYPAYVKSRPPGPAIAVTVERWSGWRAAAPGSSSS